MMAFLVLQAPMMMAFLTITSTHLLQPLPMMAFLTQSFPTPAKQLVSTIRVGMFYQYRSQKIGFYRSLTYSIVRSCSEEIICATNSFETFCEALDAAGIDNRLDGNQHHYTVFVPTNSAFDDLYADCPNINDFDDFSDSTLEDILLVHIHQDDIYDRDDLEDRCGHLLGMENGDDTRTVCENNANKIFQKGPRNPQDDAPRIISFDIDACNGIVHVTNGVILPRYVLQFEPLGEKTPSLPMNQSDHFSHFHTTPMLCFFLF